MCVHFHAHLLYHILLHHCCLHSHCYHHICSFQAHSDHCYMQTHQNYTLQMIYVSFLHKYTSAYYCERESAHAKLEAFHHP